MDVKETFFRKALSPFGDLIFALLAVLMLEPLVKSAAADSGASLGVYALDFLAFFGVYLFWRELLSIVAPDNFLGNLCVLAALMFSPLCAYTLVNTPEPLAARHSYAGLFYLSLGITFLAYAVAIYTDPARRIPPGRAVKAFTVSLCLIGLGVAIWSTIPNAIVAMLGMAVVFYLLLVVPLLLRRSDGASREPSMQSGYN